MAYYKSGGINVTSNSNVSINTASGSIASFNTNLSMPVLETKASINPIQNGTPWIDSNEVNKVPYIKRNVAGTATRIGNHLYDKLVGGTVAFNQLFLSPYTSTPSGVTFTKVDDYTVNINGTATSTSYKRFDDVPQTSIGRVYFVDIGDTINGLDIYNDGAGVNTLSNRRTIGKATAVKYFYFRVTNGTTIDNKTIKPMIIDLTAMFGSTIADYIYGLEQATAGAGVAWFKALFPNDYYAYNAGELMSVKATAHVMKNASNTVIGNYPLDSDLELRGIPKLDANNKLYYDGDTYESSGAVTRKYGIVDLGTLNWNYASKGTYFYALVSGKHNGEFNFITSKYPVNTIAGVGNLANKQCVGENNGTAILVKDSSYTDVATFKTAMSGVYLVYEKATPTTEQASPFTNPQVCDENGTEEYTDSRAVPIPVGHETYQANICEITGFDELNIQQCGVNLFDKTNTFEGYIIDTNGNFSSRTGDVSTDFISVVGGASYYVKSEQESGMWGAWYNESKEYISACTGYANRVITAPTNAKFVRLTVVHNSGNADTFGINYPATDTQYHTYSGKIIKLEFDDTVYLAEVSCLKGVWKLKLLWVVKILNGSENWDKHGTIASWFFVDEMFSNAFIDNNRNDFAITNMLTQCKYSQVTSIQNGEFGLGNSNRRFVVKNTSFTEVSDFKSWLSNNNLQVCYQLATPIEITLDETEQFEALLGVNNVWHDGNGNTEVKYRKVNIQ